MTETLTPRTQQDILNRIENRRANDPLGFEISEYIPYLDYEHAKQFLKDDCTREEWEKLREDVLNPKHAIEKYMSFAFEKAHGERGISANRSILHMIAWAWVSGDDELLELITTAYDTSYSDYGLEILRQICQHLGLDPKEHGD